MTEKASAGATEKTAGRPASDGIRVGAIDFLNSRPLLHAVETSRVALPRGTSLVKGAPATLNAALLRGELHASFVSSVEFARHHRKLVLLPGISINSTGFVDSVCLFHRGPLSSVDGGAILASGKSATSDVLLRILLERHFRLRAGVVKTGAPVDLATIGTTFAGALLIGDEALAAARAHPELSRTDLGAAWREFGNAPMVFALLAARREWAEANRGRASAVHQALLASRDWGMAHLSEVARASDHGLSVQERKAYFAKLDFRLDGPILEGLRLFFEQAYKIGAIPELPNEEALRGFR